MSYLPRQSKAEFELYDIIYETAEKQDNKNPPPIDEKNLYINFSKPITLDSMTQKEKYGSKAVCTNEYQNSMTKKFIDYIKESMYYAYLDQHQFGRDMWPNVCVLVILCLNYL